MERISPNVDECAIADGRAATVSPESSDFPFAGPYSFVLPNRLTKNSSTIATESRSATGFSAERGLSDLGVGLTGFPELGYIALSRRSGSCGIRRSATGDDSTRITTPASPVLRKHGCAVPRGTAGQGWSGPRSSPGFPPPSSRTARPTLKSVPRTGWSGPGLELGSQRITRRDAALREGGPPADATRTRLPGRHAAIATRLRSIAATARLPPLDPRGSPGLYAGRSRKPAARPPPIRTDLDPHWRVIWVVARLPDRGPRLPGRARVPAPARPGDARPAHPLCAAVPLQEAVFLAKINQTTEHNDNNWHITKSKLAATAVVLRSAILICVSPIADRLAGPPAIVGRHAAPLGWPAPACSARGSDVLPVAAWTILGRCSFPP